MRPPAFARVLAPLTYASPVRALLTGLKFHGRLSYARVLGELLADGLEAACPPWPDVLVPVPLHPTRLASRGFNQAVELARPLAGRFELAMITTGVRRQRDTLAQSDLDAPARRSNLRRAFVVDACMPPHVAIVDDVVTTGATVDALAHALRGAGAAEVSVWAVARAEA